MTTNTEVQALLERVLGMASAETVSVVYASSAEASTRFANNAITQNVARRNRSLLVRAAFGQQVGAARTNRFDDDVLREAVRRAEEIARMSAPDTEYLAPPGPSEYPTVMAFDRNVAEATPDHRASVIRDSIAGVEAAGLNSAGSYATNTDTSAIANSRGLFAYHEASSARFVCTAMTPDSSGWAADGSWRLDSVDGQAATQRAIAKALAARSPREVPAQPYTVIMEPAAAAELMAFLAWTMDAKSADEGRSAFSGKLGATVGVPDVTLSTQPDHEEVPGDPYVEDGMPARTVHWIDRGVVANLATSRYWAEKSGKPFTGRPTNLVMTGGQKSVDELVAETERGILITRFWYIRFVDPMILLLTGMTRDGLYLVEDGKVVSGVRNMRFNESPLRMLSRITDIGRAEATAGYMSAYMPALKVADFTFSSGTAF